MQKALGFEAFEFRCKVPRREVCGKRENPRSLKVTIAGAYQQARLRWVVLIIGRGFKAGKSFPRPVSAHLPLHSCRSQLTEGVNDQKSF